MIHIKIEHFAAGSPVDERGDGTLSYTQGVSSMAGQLASLFDTKLPADHAVLFLLVNPDTNLFTIMHAQGDFTKFAGQGRAYNMRIIYELDRTEHATPPLSSRLLPLVAAVDKMHPYDRREFGQPNEMLIDESVGIEQLTTQEHLLRDVLVHAVVNNQQLFIRLSDSDKHFGDDIRKSPKLHALLHAIDSLPQGIRGYVSLGFSMEAGTDVSRTLAEHLLVIAHHDNLSCWDDLAHGAMTADWQTDELKLLTAQMANEKEQKTIEQVAPLIAVFLGGGRASRNSVLGMMKLIPENVDRVLGCKTNPNENEVRIIQAVYDSNNRDAYRQQDAAKKLLQWQEAGVSCSVSPHEVLTRFPQLEKQVMESLEKRVDKAVSFEQLLQLCDDYPKLQELQECVKRKILSSVALMDGAAKHADNPLAQSLQVDVAQKAKGFTIIEKMQRLSVPYFELSLEDITADGWKSYVQLLIQAESAGADEVLRNTRPNIKAWDVSQLDGASYDKIEPHLLESEKLELKRKLLPRFEKLDAVLIRKLIALLDIGDIDELMSLAEQSFVSVIDVLLADKKSFVHDITANVLLRRYVTIKARKTPLSQINALAINSETLTEQLILQIKYIHDRAMTLEDDINFCAQNGLMTPDVTAHFEKAIEGKYCSLSLVEYARLVNLIGHSMDLSPKVGKIMFIGDAKELDNAIAKIRKAGFDKVADEILQRREQLEASGRASGRKEIQNALKQKPKLNGKRLKGHTAMSLADALDTPTMTFSDYQEMTRLIKEKEVKLGQQHLKDLFDQGMDIIEKRHAYSWLLDEQNEKEIENLLRKGDSRSIVLRLRKLLSNEQRVEFNKKFNDHLPKSWLDGVFGTVRTCDKRILISSLIAVAAIVIVTTILLWRPWELEKPKEKPVPVPSYFFVGAKSNAESIEHTDSCILGEKHLMSYLSEWYMDSFFVNSNNIGITMKSDSLGRISFPAHDNLQTCNQLFEINKAFYGMFSDEKRAKVFVSAELMTEQGDTVRVDAGQTLMAYAAEKGTGKWVSEIKVDTVSLSIDNHNFLLLNYRKQRDLTKPVYLFWLVHQIDSALKANQIERLFPY